MTRTRRSDPAGEGITRVRRGRGFSYLDAAGRPVRSAAVLERVRGLAVPPVWSEVWICEDERGHIQAVGADAAGRRQYIYHEAWRAQRDREKFKRLTGFAAARPAERADAPDAAKAISAAIEEVAEILGNTPAICRSSYVDPRVISRFKRGETIAPALRRLAKRGGPRDFAARGLIERAVLKLIG